jgi:Tfp pilus assembly protein PilV
MRSWAAEDDGFGLLESLVAATILLVGLLALGAMLVTSSTANVTSNARDGGVALQRELVEAVRALRYDELVSSTAVARVQGATGSGLGDSSPAPGWQIERAGRTYTVAIGLCSVDEVSDGTGAQDAATFCSTGPGRTSAQACSALLGTKGDIQGTATAGGAGAQVGDCGIDLDLDGAVDKLTTQEVGSCSATGCTGTPGADANPDDFKRLVTLVRWKVGGGARFALQSTVITNPGLPTAPSVTSIVSAQGTSITSGNRVNVTATTNRDAATVSWLVDGTPSDVPTGGGPRSWTWQWDLGTPDFRPDAQPAADEILDGAYLVSAKAFDKYGVASQARAITIGLNRRKPYAPAYFNAGRNGSVVELEWALVGERDVEGYRAYRDSGSGPVLVCGLKMQTACQDTSPPATGTPTYWAVAVDRDTTGALRDGDRSATDVAGASATPPDPPTGLTGTLDQGDVVLTWAASPSATVDHYRIYRDGQAFADRYDRTATDAQTQYIDTETGGVQHSYWIAAVDADLGESTLVGPVTP